MIKKSELAKQISITAICLILGFAISLQIKSVTSNYALTQSGEKARIEEVQLQLKNEIEKNEQMSGQVTQLKNELESFRSAANKNDGISQAIKDRLYNLELISGMAAIKGPGIVVTMKDAAKTQTDITGATATNTIIHDNDIRSVINELLASGAEAVALNEERIVSTTSIRCVGPTVIVNNTRFSTPFVITAIGEPKTLEAGMNLKGGVADLIRAYGITVDIKKEENIKIPAYKGAVEFKYAVKAE